MAEVAMEKNAFCNFRDKDITPIFAGIKMEAEAVFQDIKDEFRIHFVKEFTKACETYIKAVPEIIPGYIMFHLLRTDLAQGIYRCPMVFYDRGWYFHKGVRAGELQLGGMLHLYGKLWDTLCQRAKRYVGKVTMPEVDWVMQEMVGFFYGYLKELVLYSIGEATETEIYLTMHKEEDLQIRTSEYMEPGEVVYQEQPQKDLDEIRKRLSDHQEEIYLFEDYKGLELNDLSLLCHDFHYSDFRRSTLKNTNFSMSRLLGSRFRFCNMEGATLTGCLLHNTDFTGAKLMNSDFSYGLSYHGKSEIEPWKQEGYVGNSFRNCDLRGANFFRGVFMGTDFRDAILEGCNFKEAVLCESRFTKRQIAEANLSRDQLEQILLEV